MSKAKKPIYKKWWFWVAVVIIVIAIAAGGNNEPKKVNDTNNTAIADKGKSTESEPEQKTKVFNIGDSVEFDKAVFTVNGVREDKGNEFIKPKEGHIYYIVDVTVENKSNESVTVSSLLMFKLVDEEGYSYNIAIGPDTKGQLDGEIGAGRKLRGELAYEIPKDAKGLELEIDPSVWSLGKIIYKLDR